MPSAEADLSLPPRNPAWKWWVCGLLLLATMLNYMDRLTLNLTAVTIMKHFGLTARDYAQLESAFAFAFALGAIVFGWLADRWPVRWLYPAAVLAWSVAGFATGLADTFLQLLLCRAFLGLFEAGNWPCALRTTQHILPPSERTLGNSLLQSGAALGAIFTPLIVIALASEPGSWRGPFLAIGVLGVTWALLWLPIVRRGDLNIKHTPSGSSLVTILGWLVLLLAIDTTVRIVVDSEPLTIGPAFSAGVLHFDAPREARHWLPLATKVGVTVLGIAGVFFWLRRATADDRDFPRRVFFRRFWALVVMVVAINTTWHYFRAWLPLFLQTQHGYSQQEAGWFMMAYYTATDVGSLASGFAVLLLVRAGLAVQLSRVTVFLVCSMLTTLGLVVALLPAGGLLLGVLLVVGFASLALFPVYYSLSQEVTVRHQGKVTGVLGCINWLAMALLHEVVGASIQRTGKYSEGLAVAGLAPLIGLAVLLVLWGRSPTAALPDERIKV